jgi:hypothetical protein
VPKFGECRGGEELDALAVDDSQVWDPSVHYALLP